MLQQTTTSLNVQRQNKSSRNVLRRALDELDLLSLQLGTDADISDGKAVNSQFIDLESLQNRLRRKPESIMRNVCDRLGLSPPSSPSLVRKAGTSQDSQAANDLRSKSWLVQRGKLTSVRSFAFETLDLELGARRRGFQGASGISRYSCTETDDVLSKFLQNDTNQCAVRNVADAVVSTRQSFTPFSDRRSRKRQERSKRVRKPYDLPWRAQKSATLNQLYSERHVNALQSNTAPSQCECDTVSTTYNNTHARRVSAPSVLDTDDECATPTQSHPNGVNAVITTTSTAAATTSGATNERHTHSVHTLSESLTPTVSHFPAPTNDMRYMDNRTESLMIADTNDTLADELTETGTETSGVHSLGLLSTTTQIYNSFAGYANAMSDDAAPSSSYAGHLVSTRSQSNSVNSESSAVSAIALVQTSTSSQCLLRSRSLDTVGIANLGAGNADATISTYHAAAHSHFHSSHASYVSQAHSPHATIALGADSLQLATQSASNAYAAAVAAATSVHSQTSSSNGNAFAYPAEPQCLSFGRQERQLQSTVAAVGNAQSQSQSQSQITQQHSYPNFWRAGSMGQTQTQTSAGVLNSSAPWQGVSAQPAASHSQQAALQKYGVEDMVTYSLRHLRLNDR